MSAGFDNRPGSIWLDGQLVNWPEAKVHVLTHALHYASSVFEGERVYGGRIFKLREHTLRLIKSAEIMGMQIPYTADQIDAASIEAVKAQGISDGYVRPVVWRGSEQMGVSAQNSKIHLAIAAWEWPSYFSPEARAKGIRMIMAPYRRPAPECAPVHAKAAGLYMICTLSKHQAEAEGAQDALMLDYRGFVAEGTGANLFLVRDGKLHTPVADCFLNGITRQTVIALAKARGIEVVERHIKVEELSGGGELFLTGTAAEITPVGNIAGHLFTPGPMTAQLIADYEKATRG
jgi:branched-chain amino acid aminotransferase